MVVRSDALFDGAFAPSDGGEWIPHPWQDERDGYARRIPSTASRCGVPPGRSSDAARALLRPGLRPGDHAVHLADVRRSDLARARPRDADPGPALVVVGGIRLADQRLR